MDRLDWQSLIFVSIAGAYLFKFFAQKINQNADSRFVENLPFYVILGWVAWTLLVAPNYIKATQLTTIGVVGGLGFLIFRHIQGRDIRVDYLERALRDAQEIRNPNFEHAIEKQKGTKDPDSELASKIYPISGLNDLRSELFSALSNTSERLLIMSGWASSYVIDEQFISKSLILLGNGAELHLGFGYDSSSEKRRPAWERQGRKQIQHLKLRAMDEGLHAKLFIYEFDNHYKSIVKDSEYFVTGSINWLSNSRGKNYERAWKIEFPELVQKEFEDCLSVMRLTTR